MKSIFGAVLSIAIGILACTGCADHPSFFDPGELGALRKQDSRYVMSRDEAIARTAAPVPPAAAVAGKALAPVALDVAEPPAAGATRPDDPRLVVYSAAFRVVVANVAGSLASIREKAEQLGGHLQNVSGGTITVRVPAARFNDAVAFIERVGEVADRQLNAVDVTEEMQDLRIHLDNSEKLRQRYLELLQKAQKVEDSLKIESELARVTEELDRTKGKIRYLESQVAMSTIRVELNSPAPQNTPMPGSRLPFEWIGDLGAGLVEGQVQQTVRRAGIFGHGPRFKPPTSFVRYFQDDDQTEAMSADGLRLRVLRRENVDKAPLEFWSVLTRKSLVDNRSLAVAGDETGKDYYFLRGTRDVGGKPLGYLLSLKRSNSAVVVFEAWGPKDKIDAAMETLRSSALSVDPK